MTASATIADVMSRLKGEPVFLAGSLVAEETYGMTNAHKDVDIFCPTGNVLVSVGQQLLCQGYTFDDRFSRVWARWKKYGFKQWHTNSLRMYSPAGIETNLVYKMTDGHPTTSLGQVIESFDFGLLAVGYDLETMQRMDMRSYLFPGMDPDGPLPLMPNKKKNWELGFISQYNAIRQFGRYAKYYQYGYDLSLVKTSLVTGYEAAALHFYDHFDEDKRQLSGIYDAISKHIAADNIDELVTASKQIDFNDQLDAIMEALE